MSLVLPYSRVGPAINETPINSNFQAIADKFNAGLVGTDFAPNANAPGTIIAVGTLPADRIVPLSITAAQIANATITGTQIAASSIAGGNIGGATILSGNMKFGVDDYALTGTVQTNPTGSKLTAFTTATGLPIGYAILFNGAPPVVSNYILPSVYLNQSTNFFYTVYSLHPNANSLTSLVGFTIRAYFIPST